MSSVTPQQAIELGLRHHRAGELPQAESIYRQVLAHDPQNPDALHLLGVIAHQMRKHEDAAELISRAIQIRANEPDYHSNLGEALAAMGQFDRAMASYRQAIVLNPGHIFASNNLAMALLAQNRDDEARAVLQAALDASPNSAAVLNNLGILQSRQGKLNEAVESFARAAKLDPNYSDAIGNLGVAQLSLNHLEEAVVALEQSLRLKPNDATALNNLGMTLQAQGVVERAINAYRAAMQVEPQFYQAYSNLLLALHYQQNHTRAQIFEEHLAWARRYAPGPAIPGTYANSRDPNRRLRIGYVSADFRLHSVMFFLEPLLEAHDRSQVEVFCYSDTHSPDAATQRLLRLADQWRDMRGASDEQMAQLVRHEAIDVLVDLSGHTGMHRLLMFARKPAPVQVSYLGYPDTTGLAAMDYRITDIWADPPGKGDDLHVEKLARLPRCAWCYRPPDASPQVMELPALRTGQVTFGSFNTLGKVNDDVLTTWARILSAVPRSRLLLKAHGLDDSGARRRIVEVMKGHGIDADRLVLRGRAASMEQHVAAYHEIDVALDSFPYHGTTTTCDALWMGAPVVTLAGDRHVSRVGVSLLSAVGLTELIAPTVDEYVRIAGELANDRSRLAELRGGLRRRMQDSPLMDAKSLARELESAYRQMWTRWCDTPR